MQGAAEYASLHPPLISSWHGVGLAAHPHAAPFLWLLRCAGPSSTAEPPAGRAVPGGRLPGSHAGVREPLVPVAGCRAPPCGFQAHIPCADALEQLHLKQLQVVQLLCQLLAWA